VLFSFLEFWCKLCVVALLLSILICS
jgi:hypothetical protein